MLLKRLQKVFNFAWNYTRSVSGPKVSDVFGSTVIEFDRLRWRSFGSSEEQDGRLVTVALDADSVEIWISDKSIEGGYSHSWCILLDEGGNYTVRYMGEEGDLEKIPPCPLDFEKEEICS